jgi:hypothetical protein
MIQSQEEDQKKKTKSTDFSHNIRISSQNKLVRKINKKKKTKT